MLPEPVMPREPPVPDATGKMPPPILITVNNERFFAIGYSWDITTGDGTQSDEAVYVLIVQAVPKPSSIIVAGPDAMEQIRAMVPEPGKIN